MLRAHTELLGWAKCTIQLTRRLHQNLSIPIFTLFYFWQGTNFHTAFTWTKAKLDVVDGLQKLHETCLTWIWHLLHRRLFGTALWWLCRIVHSGRGSKMKMNQQGHTKWFLKNTHSDGDFTNSWSYKDTTTLTLAYSKTTTNKFKTEFSDMLIATNSGLASR